MKFLIGFSELQIDPVIKNCDKLFSIDDVRKYVEIWDIKHAHNILRIVGQTFGDVADVELSNYNQLECLEDDDNDFGDWNYILDDDALCALAMEIYLLIYWMYHLMRPLTPLQIITYQAQHYVLWNI